MTATKTIFQSAIPFISATFVYRHLDGIDFFTRALDSLVISFIVLWLTTQLIESAQALVSSISIAERCKTTVALVKDQKNTTGVVKENILFYELTPPATPPATLKHSESIPTLEAKSTTTTVTTTATTIPTTTTELSPTFNSTITKTIATSNIRSMVAPNQPYAPSPSETPVLTSEPEQMIDQPPMLSPLKERAYQVRNTGSAAGRRPRAPVMSFSTPLRRRSHYDVSVPLPLATPMSPPALSPSHSTSSTGSCSAFESDLLRLRRASRVEEMIHKFDHNNTMANKRVDPQRRRRYSVGCADDYPKVKPVIRNRTYGFKPTVGIWEQRIKETAEVADKTTTS
ncbi:hypothetical protein BX666DRAFT_1981137 [Dichotomocladium elegans]|nr:hypothetical protein BX666DRAFT_1981137 [Dichotomocladium elegans]